MNQTIDHQARKHLAGLARRLAAGAITNDEFESEQSISKETTLRDIYFYGLWPLYDDFVEHKLVGRWALTREGRASVARIVLFLHSGQPYCWPQLTGFSRLPVIFLSLITFGWFGRFWRRRKWRGGDETVWPFFSRSEYEEALKHPAFLNGTAPQRVQPGRT